MSPGNSPTVVAGDDFLGQIPTKLGDERVPKFVPTVTDELDDNAVVVRNFPCLK